MSFPNLGHPISYYRRTWLQTVVAQIRFNPILKIGQEAPATFQDKVRGAFPKFLKEQSVGFQFAVGGAGVPQIAPTAPVLTPTVWRFKTDDDAWTGGLSVDFLSLETTNYDHFSGFESRFEVLCRALQETYGIGEYLRVGLRYINLLERTSDYPPWLELLNGHLLGPISDPQIGPVIREIRQAFVLADEDWTISVQHGTENSNYRLDLDHATETRVAARELQDRLRSFNLRLYQMFRWAISDRLHSLMEPRPRE